MDGAQEQPQFFLTKAKINKKEAEISHVTVEVDFAKAIKELAQIEQTPVLTHKDEEIVLTEQTEGAAFAALLEEKGTALDSPLADVYRKIFSRNVEVRKLEEKARLTTVQKKLPLQLEQTVHRLLGFNLKTLLVSRESCNLSYLKKLQGKIDIGETNMDLAENCLVSIVDTATEIKKHEFKKDPAKYQNLLGQLYKKVYEFYQFNPYYQAKVNLKPLTVTDLTSLARRDFLKLAGSTVGAGLGLAGVAAFKKAVVDNPVISTCLVALEARPKLEFEYKDSAFYLSPEKIEEEYHKHFNGREDLISLDFWRRNLFYLQSLAFLYYPAYLEQTGLTSSLESWGKFMDQFLEQTHEIADTLGMDFVVLTSSLRVSAQNLLNSKGESISGYEEDRTMGQAQVASSFVNQLLPKGELRQKYRQEMGELLTSNSGLKGRIARFSSEHAPFNYYDVIRLMGPITLGMNDMEVEIAARALFDPSLNGDPGVVKARRELEETYPEAAVAYKNLLVKREKVEKERMALKNQVDVFIALDNGVILDKFFDPETCREALLAIGITDEWQRTQTTMAWEHLAKDGGSYYKDKDEIMDPNGVFVGAMVNLFSNELGIQMKDIKLRRERLMSDQILNPKFIDYLKEQAQDRPDVLKILESMKEKRGQFQEKCDEMAIAEKGAVAVVGQYELDQRFQLLTGISQMNLLSKRVEAEFGLMNSSDKNSLAFHLYSLVSIRDIADLDSLHALFARNCEVDCVYDYQETLHKIEQLFQLMKENGWLRQSPEDDFGQFLNACQKIKDRDMTGFTEVVDGKSYPTVEWGIVANYYLRYYKSSFYSAFDRAESVINSYWHSFKEE